MADIDDPALKDRIDGLKVIRDQAKADAERAQVMLESSGAKAVTPQMLRRFAETARQRIRLEGGGYRRDHLRAFAQRVEVADGEVRIMGSKSRLLQTLTAKNSVNSVPTQGLKWRRGWDSNPRYACTHTRFPSVRLKPLGHLSRGMRETSRAAGYRQAGIAKRGWVTGEMGLGAGVYGARAALTRGMTCSAIKTIERRASPGSRQSCPA